MGRISRLNSTVESAARVSGASNVQAKITPNRKRTMRVTYSVYSQQNPGVSPRQDGVSFSNLIFAARHWDTRTKNGNNVVIQSRDRPGNTTSAGAPTVAANVVD